MKSNFKRFMGIVLAMLMVVTMLPMTAFAEDEVVLTAADSPDYVKTADGALELLYNGDTITGTDGKVYAGFIIAKDYQNSSDRLGARFATTETLSDGSANPNTKLYGIYKFQTGYPITVKEPLETVVMNGLPQKIADNLYLNTWNNTGSTYWLGVRGGEGPAKSIAYITLPSGENMLRHGAYLKSQMDNNPNPWQTGLVTYTGAMVRDPQIYSNSLYDPAKGTVKHSGVAAEYNYGSTFPAFYLALDAFKEVKMDVATMGANVKAFLAENFIQDDFCGLDYTADDFAAMGVVEVPANPTPAHSPNYLKVVTTDGKITEYLYNDVITENGKKYIGLVGAKLMNASDSALGAHFAVASGNDIDGNPLPTDAVYMNHGIIKEWNNNKYNLLQDTYMSWVPTAIQPYLHTYNYDMGKDTSGSGTVSSLRSITKLAITNKDEVTAHKTYLEPLAKSNGVTDVQKQYIITSTGHGGWGFYRWNITNQNFVTGNTFRYPNGSVFIRFYVDADMFKTVKLDVNSMRSNVRAMMKANFVRTDLEGIYTDAELDKMGIQSFTAEEKPATVTGSSFVVGGKTFYFMNDVRDYNGKKYFRVFSKKGTVYWNGADARYLVSERPEGGLYLTHKQGSTTGTDLQNMTTDFEVFGDYKISSDFEWSHGEVLYNGNRTPVYLKGSVNVGSLNDFKYMSSQGITFTYQGDMSITSTLAVHGGGTVRKVWVEGKREDADGMTYVADGNYYKGGNSPRYHFVTYISEDFFKENELDLATTGEVMIDAIKANFTREELAAGGWSEATLDALFNTGYTGTGLGIVAYKTDADSVAVVINNNFDVASTGTKLVVVAAYNGEKLEDIQLVEVRGVIPANAYTSKIPVDLEVGNAAISEIKVMLWDGILTAKPLANVVTLN